MERRKKVLLVDDREDGLCALRAALDPLGLPLEPAATGEAGLKAALRGDVGVAVLDVSLPGLGGLEAARYLARLEQTRHIPVILVTGADREGGLEAQAAGLGVADLMPKPVDPWSLRIKVRYLYRISQRLQSAA
ncbi:response regulator [Streptomyces sp. NPDC001941]|uniref:response regulator n=1 Tax=Streptomyces sp. NPDC001941 TaxID=3154659 RepID=UPI00331D12F4